MFTYAHFYEFEGQQSDAFDLTGMNQGLPPTQQQQLNHRKTPEQFLGDNAGLVNLDQLVTNKSSTGLCYAFIIMNKGQGHD